LNLKVEKASTSRGKTY